MSAKSKEKILQDHLPDKIDLGHTPTPYFDAVNRVLKVEDQGFPLKKSKPKK